MSVALYNGSLKLNSTIPACDYNLLFVLFCFILFKIITVDCDKKTTKDSTVIIKINNWKILLHCYFKIQEATGPLLFLNNNDPAFCILLFATHILDLFFQGHKPTHVFQNKNSGSRLTGRLGVKVIMKSD